MRITLTTAALVLTAAACSAGGRKAPLEVAAPRLAAWPDDPCAVLTAAEVAAATGLEVVGARRAPSIAKLVQAQADGREPGPGRWICSYETRGGFGAITIVVPPFAEREASKYRADRDAYFVTYPGSARPIPGVGQDAWIGGGTVLRVLGRDDLYFAVAVQMFPEGTSTRRLEEVLVAVARAVLARLDAERG